MSETGSGGPTITPGGGLYGWASRTLQAWPALGRWAGAATVHEVRALVRGQPPTPWAPLRVPLGQATVAVVTTAGVHLRTDAPFSMDVDDDVSFRAIPADADPADLQVTHAHFDQSDARRDVNLVFPLPLLRELAAEGVVGRVADTHYSFGFFLDSRRLVAKTGSEVARLLKQQDVDLALLVPA